MWNWIYKLNLFIYKLFSAQESGPLIQFLEHLSYSSIKVLIASNLCVYYRLPPHLLVIAAYMYACSCSSTGAIGFSRLQENGLYAQSEFEMNPFKAQTVYTLWSYG
jgi:hypothetical protein